MRHRHVLAVCAILLFLAGCASRKTTVAGYSHGRTPAARPRQPTVMPQSGTVGILPNYALPANQPYRVEGSWYYPLRAYDFYDAFGIASWYGPDFHGKMTSSGELYNMEGLTAAHRVLPIPSLVRVTSLATGKSVVLTVNDRGPFVGNREIDLSYGAAKALGVAEKGLALVHVELLPPSTSLAQDASGFYLQTGSFKDAANARSMTQHLSGFGFKNAKVISGASHYRVVVGPYDNPEDAHAAQSQLKQDLGINAVFSAGE